jgi:NOL1/NOP2/sun family putative RNA methylase
MVELPQQFLTRMRKQLGGEFESFLKSFNNPVTKGIRVNTLKITKEEFLKISPFALEEIPWEPNGFYADGESLGKTVLHAAGAYYVQEPSAMCAVPNLNIEGEERVLDLCAAPGGKITQIAAQMNGRGILIANEIISSRFQILKSNLERLGVKNVTALNMSPENLSKIFEGYFDKILVDAPCSGEGMFKKEPNAIPEWSPENVAICAARQREILSCADKMLGTGGKIVYSTCTFAPDEDFLQIENFLNEHKNYTLSEQKILYPHKVKGEGHFCAVLCKEKGEERADLRTINTQISSKKDREIIEKYREWESETLTCSLDNLYISDGFLYSSYNNAPDIASYLPHSTNTAGVLLGHLSADGKRFEPSHRLAMCLKCDEVKHIEVDENTALKYLRGITFDCSEREKGWRVVSFNNLPLGWCKCVNGTIKNHLPKGVRI